MLETSQVVGLDCLVGPLVFDVLEDLQLLLVLLHYLHLVGVQDDLDLPHDVLVVGCQFLVDLVDALEQVEQSLNGYLLEPVDDVLVQLLMAQVFLDDEADLMVGVEDGQECDFQPKDCSLDVLQLLPVQDLLELDKF